MKAPESYSDAGPLVMLQTQEGRKAMGTDMESSTHRPLPSVFQVVTLHMQLRDESREHIGLVISFKLLQGTGAEVSRPRGSFPAAAVPNQ